jgi:hypothetical protein
LQAKLQLSQSLLSLSCDDYVALFWSEVPEPYAGLVLGLTSASLIALTILSTFHFGELRVPKKLGKSNTILLCFVHYSVQFQDLQGIFRAKFETIPHPLGLTPYRIVPEYTHA